MDVARRDRSRRERAIYGRGLQPLPFGQRMRGIEAAARTDKGIATDQVQP